MAQPLNIEGGSLTAVQVRTLALVTSAVVLEGFDIQLIGLAAPAIIAEWGIHKQSMGLAMAGALVGMAIGAALGGRLGDYFGRRPVLIACIALFGACTVVAAFTDSTTELALSRVLAGIGFGAALASGPALIAEGMPKRISSQLVALTVIGVPCGGMLGAAMGAWLIPALGWRIAFIVGGTLPVLLAIVMLWALPESPHFVRSRVAAGTRSHAGQLLLPEFRRTSVGLWVAFFSSLAVSYAFFNWIPVLLSTLHMPADVAIRGSMFFNLAGAGGAIVGSHIAVRAGSKRVLLVFVAIGIAAVLSLAFLLRREGDAVAPTLVVIGIAIAGVAGVGMQAALYALAAHAYPTHFRATGIGVAGSIGRVGGMASSFTGGTVLALASGPSVFFAIVGALLVASGLGILIIDRHSPPLRGEE